MKKISFIIELLRLKRRFLARLESLWGTKKQTYVTERVSFYKSMWRNAAKRMGADFKELGDEFWEVSNGRRKVRLNNYKVPLDDPVTLSLAGKKELCFKILGQTNVPIPEHTVFQLTELDKGRSFLKDRKGPVVIKPASDTSAGRGVTTWVETDREFISAVALASLYDNRILIEQMIAGELYRLLFLDKEMIHAARRTGVRVTGDGVTELSELARRALEKQQSTTLNTVGNLLENDKDWQFTLNAQGLTGNQVPADGREILVKSITEPAAGREMEIIPQYTENFTGRICPSIVESAMQAVDQLGICFAGVDLIAVDPTVPLQESGGAIIEINTTPGLHHHYNLEGETNSAQPADLVLHYLLSANDIAAYK
jgi:cyanophycin synthetase